MVSVGWELGRAWLDGSRSMSPMSLQMLARAAVIWRCTWLAAGVASVPGPLSWISLILHNMLLASPRESSKRPSRSYSAFYDLASQVIHCHFSRVMLATQTNPDSVWEVLYKGVSTRRYGLLGPFWKLATTGFYMELLLSVFSDAYQIKCRQVENIENLVF